MRKSQPKTLNLKAIVKNRNVMLLVDFDNSHNCLDINVTKQLNFFVYSTKDLTIMITDGQRVNAIGRSCKVSIKMQELELQRGFHSLPLNGMVMVLGVKWLMQLGTYSTNLEEQFMEFKLQGQHYNMYGGEGSTLKKDDVHLMKCQKHR